MLKSKTLPCSSTAQGNLMFSVNQQDYYLYTRHFQNLKRPGVYLDIATNHPIYSSNTFFFDRCLQWSGICVEASDVYFEPIFRERSCILVPTCISSTDGEEVQFKPFALQGGVISPHYKFLNTVKSGKDSIKTLRCTTVEKILARSRLNVIDFLSLDVEGHEVNVLQGVDFDKVIINVISVEIGPRLKDVQTFLEGKGYQRHILNKTAFEKANYNDFMRADAIFVHRSVVFGQPQ